MSKYVDCAKQLRSIEKPHYNCAQAVLVPFAREAGIDEDVAFRLAFNFARGMRQGSTCGAVSGALMVFGLYDLKDGATLGEFYNRFKANHNNCLNCPDLMREGVALGMESRDHCDAMIYECVRYVEEILREKGKID